MTTREARAGIFFETALAVGFLTEALTRFISLMRITPSVLFCLPAGIVFLLIVILDLGLADD